MARVNMTCSKCGKEYTARKEFHKRSEADNWEKYMTNNGVGTCPECWKAEKEAEREKARSEKEKEASEILKNCPISFPALEGSEKQIAWATDLRNGIIVAMGKQGIRWDKIQEAAKTDPAVKAEWDKLTNPSAHWWIDNRGKAIFNRFFIGFAE